MRRLRRKAIRFEAALRGHATVNPTDAAFIRLTGVAMEGEKSKPANGGGEGIRRNTPRGYSDLQGLAPFDRRNH